MDVRTLKKKLLSGDEKDRRELAKWLDGLSDEDQRRLEALGEPEPEVNTRALFWADLLTIKTVIDSTPAYADLEELGRRAAALGSCEEVQVLGLRSYQARALGYLDRAEGLLRAARERGSSCPVRPLGHPELSACGLDLDRRLAILEAAQGEGANAMRRVQRVLDGYEVLGHAGHDIDGDGIATSQLALGVIRGYLGDYGGAAAHFSTCLDRFQAGSPIWERAQLCFTTAVARTDRAGRELAWDVQERRRLRICHRKGTTEFAYFYWTDGQLAHALGKARRRWRGKMLEALKEFAAQRMPNELIGVGHDLALMVYPDWNEVRKVVFGHLLPLAKDLVTDARQKKALNEVLGLLRGRCPHPETVSLLGTALSRLRQAAGAHLPPCLVSSNLGLAMASD